MISETAPLIVVGLGEVVWDLFPSGRRLGGAPANVAYHATMLGERGVLASRVGLDALGDQAVARLKQHGVDVGAVQRDAQHSTGTVEVTFEAGTPRFAIDGAAAWTRPDWTDAWAEILSRAAAICFGTVLQAFPAGRAVLQRAMAVAPRDALRLLDVNLRPPFDTAEAIESALEAANAVKLDEEEARTIGRRYGTSDPAGWLIERRGMRAVAITRAESGSVLFTAAGSDEQPGLPTESPHPEADPVGAGDAFTAAMACQLARGHSPAQTNAAANRYAAYVASQPGAMPPVPPEIRGL